MLDSKKYEEIFLSGLLTDIRPNLILLERIKPEHFTEIKLKRIYIEILKIHKRGEEPTPLNFEKFDQNYILEMYSSFTNPRETEKACNLLLESHARRFIAKKAFNLSRLVEDSETSLESLIEADNQKPEYFQFDGIEDQKSLVESALKNFDEIVTGKEKRMLTGSCFIDYKTDGLEKGSLNVIAARPGNGKTSFVIDLIHNFTGKVMFYSLEMNKLEIGRKLFSREMGANSIALKEKSFIQSSQSKIIEAGKKLSSKKFWADYRTGKTPSEILSQCKYLKHKFGLDLIVIDYLQIMKLGEKAESKTIEVGKISQALKDIAKILDIPIIVLSQLGRAGDQRTDKRPMISDLRWAGEIEENAHKIIFLHIPSKYDDKEDPNKTEIIMPKNRSGESDVFTDIYVDRTTSTYRFYTKEDENTWQAKRMTDD